MKQATYLTFVEYRPKGDLAFCEWRNHLLPAKDEQVVLCMGQTGTRYLVCVDCFEADEARLMRQ